MLDYFLYNMSQSVGWPKTISTIGQACCSPFLVTIPSLSGTHVTTNNIISWPCLIKTLPETDISLYSFKLLQEVSDYRELPNSRKWLSCRTEETQVMMSISPKRWASTQVIVSLH